MGIYGIATFRSNTCQDEMCEGTGRDQHFLVLLGRFGGHHRFVPFVVDSTDYVPNGTNSGQNDG